jgi:hypothetical protein
MEIPGEDNASWIRPGWGGMPAKLDAGAAELEARFPEVTSSAARSASVSLKLFAEAKRTGFTSVDVRRAPAFDVFDFDWKSRLCISQNV